MGTVGRRSFWVAESGAVGNDESIQIRPMRSVRCTGNVAVVARQFVIARGRHFGRVKQRERFLSLGEAS